MVDMGVRISAMSARSYCETLGGSVLLYSNTTKYIFNYLVTTPPTGTSGTVSSFTGYFNDTGGVVKDVYGNGI